MDWEQLTGDICRPNGISAEKNKWMFDCCHQASSEENYPVCECVGTSITIFDHQTCDATIPPYDLTAVNHLRFKPFYLSIPVDSVMNLRS